MKTRINPFMAGLVIFIMTSVAGISQESKIDLKSTEIQQKVFNQILNDNDLLKSFIAQLQTNEDAKNVIMSNMMMKCSKNSCMCKNLTEKMSEHDMILEQLGKLLLEKNDTKYAVKPRPRYKHK